MRFQRTCTSIFMLGGAPYFTDCEGHLAILCATLQLGERVSSIAVPLPTLEAPFHYHMSAFTPSGAGEVFTSAALNSGLASKELAHAIVGLASPTSIVVQVGSLENRVSVDGAVLSLKAGNSGRISMLQKNSFFFGKPQSLLLRPSSDRMSPNHIMEGDN